MTERAYQYDDEVDSIELPTKDKNKRRERRERKGYRYDRDED